MQETVLPGHGSGGKLMSELIHKVIKETLDSGGLQLDDSAVLPVDGTNIVFTTDSYTITPIFFPGGNIGDLAVNGTVNDLAVMGATPRYLSCGLILEEGLPLEELKAVLQAMRAAADKAGVKIVTGDTKVVEKGKGDKIFINTAGIGVLTQPLQRRAIEVGDKIIVNGTLGDHGIAVMAERNGLSFTEGLKTDCAPLNLLLQPLMEAFPGKIRFIRDATRGGAASVLNEIVEGQPFSVRLIEEDIPVKDEVQGVCDILGIEPLYAANEGKLVMVADATVADAIVQKMRELPFGNDAAVIGEVTGEFDGVVFVQTPVGGRRMLPLLTEDQLPRIC